MPPDNEPIVSPAEQPSQQPERVVPPPPPPEPFRYEPPVRRKNFPGTDHERLVPNDQGSAMS
jgi:hypothetical protein